MTSLREVLINRDGVPDDIADELIAQARLRVAQGEDPEEVLEEEFGLEADYMEELL